MRSIASIPGRIRVVTGVILFLGFLLIVRLYYVQMLQGEDYQERARKQYVHTADGIFDRGTIYYTTKDGEKVGAASMKSGYVLAVNPTLITDAGAVFEKL
jgi:cell division protein FtsI/penicillin-binding protein 2